MQQIFCLTVQTEATGRLFFLFLAINPDSKKTEESGYVRRKEGFG